MANAAAAANVPIGSEGLDVCGPSGTFLTMKERRACRTLHPPVLWEHLESSSLHRYIDRVPTSGIRRSSLFTSLIDTDR